GKAQNEQCFPVCLLNVAKLGCFQRLVLVGEFWRSTCLALPFERVAVWTHRHQRLKPTHAYAGQTTVSGGGARQMSLRVRGCGEFTPALVVAATAVPR